jgi:hypothetical protein
MAERKLHRPASPELHRALNNVHGAAEGMMIDTHPMEVHFDKDPEHGGYPGVAKILDHHGKVAHEVRHKVVRHLIRLGGHPDGHEPPRDHKDAYERTYKNHEKMQGTIKQLIAVARSENEEKVVRMAEKLYKRIDAEMHDLEREHAKARTHGDNYLLRKM